MNKEAVNCVDSIIKECVDIRHYDYNSTRLSTLKHIIELANRGIKAIEEEIEKDNK